MGQMKNIAGCQKAFFQEFVPRFQLACITLWLFPSSTPLFEVFQAAHVGISALPQLLQNSPAQSSQLAQVPAEPTPSQGVKWGSCTRSTTVGQLGEGNTANTSLPRHLSVFVSEHKPQNTWKQVTWLVYIPQTRAQCGEIPYSGFHLSHGVCKHSAHKY